MSAMTVPRHAQEDDDLMFDDHDELLVEIEQQAKRWTAEAFALLQRGGDANAARTFGEHAEQLRALARAHAR